MLSWAGKIEEIEGEEAAFYQFIDQLVGKILAPARLFPIFGPQRLLETHGAWCNDLQRVGKHEKRLGNGLDHFKRAGHLAFWFRRFTPLLDAQDMNLALDSPDPLTADQDKFRAFLLNYLNEYIAFEIGYQFCKYYETARSNPSERSSKLVLDADYIETMCHFLKYKTVSPHALSMVYRSLFHR